VVLEWADALIRLCDWPTTGFVSECSHNVYYFSMCHSQVDAVRVKMSPSAIPRVMVLANLSCSVATTAEQPAQAWWPDQVQQLTLKPFALAQQHTGAGAHPASRQLACHQTPDKQAQGLDDLCCSPARTPCMPSLKALGSVTRRNRAIFRLTSCRREPARGLQESTVRAVKYCGVYSAKATQASS
jgi:hypothetical protein